MSNDPTAPVLGVTVTCRTGSEHTLPSVDLSVSIPSQAAPVRARMTALGLGPLRTLESKRKHEAERSVGRYRVLAKQVDAAKAKLAAAERTLERTAAADRLLRDEPGEDFANNLRKVTAELEAAKKAKAEAEADLPIVSEPLPKLFAAAASVVASRVEAVSLQATLAMDPVTKAARDRVAEGCRLVEEAVRLAVEKFLVGPMVELLAAQHAERDGWDGRAALAVETATALLGPAPYGVARKGTQFVVLPPTPPTPPDPTAADRVWLAEQERAYAAGQA